MTVGFGSVASGQRSVSQRRSFGVTPYRLTVDDKRVRFLASERTGAVILFESGDGGERWKRTALSSLPEEGAAELGPHGWFAVDDKHRLLTAR
jgi:hypothetical protein